MENRFTKNKRKRISDENKEISNPHNSKLVFIF